MLWGRPFFKRCMSALMPSSRPTDSLALGVDLPQEEEFALSNMTPVRTTISGCSRAAWLRIATNTSPSTRRQEAEREEFLQALDKVIRIALYVSGKKRFLRKNPPHTGRVRMLLERYPGARFIYLIRNPYVVFESTQHFFRSTLDAIRMQEITQSELTGRFC